MPSTDAGGQSGQQLMVHSFQLGLLSLDQGQHWPGWAVLTLTAAALVPTLYVTIALRRVAPQARTPIVPAVLVLVLALAGGGLSFFVSRV